MSTRTLRCPSCDGPMRVVDRRGLTIDICNECRGIFLDRGELEKLLETVDRWEGAQDQPIAPPPPQPPHPGPGPGALPQAPPPPPGYHPGPGPGTLPQAPPPPPGYGQHGYAQPGQRGLGGIGDILSAVVMESKKHSRRGDGHGYGRRKRRKGGLGELFGDLLD